MQKKVVAIILAAGKSVRMKSDIPKVLHPICGRPMLGYVLDIIRELNLTKTIFVLGHKHEQVKKLLLPGAKVVIQKRVKGTADAVNRPCLY